MKIILLILCSLFFTGNLKAQSFLSGGFETSPPFSFGSCGLTPNQLQQDIFSIITTNFATFGTGKTCYTDGAQVYGEYNEGRCPGQTPDPTEGVFSIGLSKDVTFALKLSANLVPGTCYTVTFDVRNASSSGDCTTPAKLEFGESSNATSFGNTIYTMASNVPNTDVWQPSMFSFLASNSGINYITFRIPSSADVESFLFVDNLTINPTTCNLPIVLNNFTAKVKNCSTLLNWHSAEEINVAKFEIERKGSRTLSFTKIATIAANGSNNSYSYIDNLPDEGANQYRLKMIDRDGKFTYSLVRNVVVQCNSIAPYTVYPTFVRDVVNIKGVKLGQTIQLYSATGQLLTHQKVVNTSTQLNLSMYSSAMYMLVIINDNQHVFTQKINKIK